MSSYPKIRLFVTTDFPQMSAMITLLRARLQFVAAPTTHLVLASLHVTSEKVISDIKRIELSSYETCVKKAESCSIIISHSNLSIPILNQTAALVSMLSKIISVPISAANARM